MMEISINSDEKIDKKFVHPDVIHELNVRTTNIHDSSMVNFGTRGDTRDKVCVSVIIILVASFIIAGIMYNN